MDEFDVKELGTLLADNGYIRGPFGSALKRGELSEKGIPVYEQKNAIDNSREFRFFVSPEKFQELKRFQVKTNDLIISCSGTVGKISIIGENDPKGIISQALLILRPDIQKITVKYLYHFLSSRQGFELITQASHGSVQVNIAERKVVETIPVPTPATTEEQNAITSILSSLDDKIELLHRQSKTLEAIAETLFRQWFVEDAHEDWDENSLSGIAGFLNGLACQKFPPLNEQEKLPVLKIKELSSDITKASDWASSTVKSKYIIEAGDVIFSWSASLMVKVWGGEKCVLNQHLFKVTSENYPKWFYLMWCRQHLAEFASISSSHATTMGHIKRGDLDKAVVFIPPKNVLEAMSAIMEPMLNKQIENAKQIRSLEKLRDSLLPKLISGEVRVEYRH